MRSDARLSLDELIQLKVQTVIKCLFTTSDGLSVENRELHARLTTDHPEIDWSAMRAEWLQFEFVITIRGALPGKFCWGSPQHWLKTIFSRFSPW